MRSQMPLAPCEPAYDVTVHIVLDDFGRKFGRTYVETDERQTDENAIIENIIAGEYSYPQRVIAFNTAEGWSRDVTEDIARLVADRVSSEQRTLLKSTQEFLQRVLGHLGYSARVTWRRV